MIDRPTLEAAGQPTAGPPKEWPVPVRIVWDRMKAGTTLSRGLSILDGNTGEVLDMDIAYEPERIARLACAHAGDVVELVRFLRNKEGEIYLDASREAAASEPLLVAVSEPLRVEPEVLGFILDELSREVTWAAFRMASNALRVAEAKEGTSNRMDINDTVF